MLNRASSLQKLQRKGGPNDEGNSMTSSGVLSTASVNIDADCVGERWETTNFELLARAIAIIAMGQASYAARIVTGLTPNKVEYSDQQLRVEARIRLTCDDTKARPKKGYPQWQRDGFIFQAISYLAAKNANLTALIKSPHHSATSQGLDGLMIEMNAEKTGIERTTLCEDKCVDDARATFLSDVLPEFIRRQKNERNAEIIAAAEALIQTAGIDEMTAAEFASEVTDTKKRRYRSAFAVSVDSEKERKRIFADFNRVEDIGQTQRLGASFIVPPDMREWFESLAKEAISYLDSLEEQKS